MAFEIHRPYPGVALIVTELGSILMGAPTDAFKATRKYCTDHELPFPKVLVAPTDMLARYVPQFNPEFFLYDFLFVYGAAFKPELAGERLQLVLDKDQVEGVKDALRITLTGPTLEELRSYRDEQGTPLVDDESARLLAGISSHMALKRDDMPRVIDDMLDVQTFDARNTIELLDGNVIVERLHHNSFQVRRGQQQEDINLAINQRVAPFAMLPAPPDVQRPLRFGIKPLGVRSGFDLSGPSTGFVIWVEGKVCVYDGPVGTRYLLEAQGISCDDIAMVVLSHCHEDHMGSFVELVLSGTRPAVYTTEPIYRSALIKLSSYFKMPEAQVAEFIDYHRVEPNVPFDHLGATFELFYTVHAIPALGISVSYQDHKVLISGDTLHHEGLDDYYKAGVITDDIYQRMRALVPNSKAPHDLYCCDVGESIIHGHPGDWSDNPNRILYYHCPDNEHIRSFGRELAIPGQTVELIENARMVRATPPRLLEALAFLDVDSPAWVQRFIDEGTLLTFQSGDVVASTGDALGQALHIVVEGLLEAAPSHTPEALLIRPGEFFGFSEYIDHQGHCDTEITCTSPSEIFKIPEETFSEFMQAFDLGERLPAVAAARPIIDSHVLFHHLKMGQRNVISLRSRRESHSADALITPSGSVDDDFFILIEGEVTIKRGKESLTTLRSDLSNNFFGISSVLSPGTPRDTDVIAKSDVELLRIPHQTIRDLFDENMGIRYLLTAKGAERRSAGE